MVLALYNFWMIRVFFASRSSDWKVYWISLNPAEYDQWGILFLVGLPPITHYKLNGSCTWYLSEQSVVSISIKLILAIFCKFESEKSTGAPQKLGCFRNISIQRWAKTHIFGCSTIWILIVWKSQFSYCKLKNGISCSKFAYLSLIFCNIMRIRYISTDLVKFGTAAKF